MDKIVKIILIIITICILTGVCFKKKENFAKKKKNNKAKRKNKNNKTKRKNKKIRAKRKTKRKTKRKEKKKSKKEYKNCESCINDKEWFRSICKLDYKKGKNLKTFKKKLLNSCSKNCKSYKNHKELLDLSCKILQFKTPEGKLKLYWQDQPDDFSKELDKKKNKKIYNCVEKNFKRIDTYLKKLANPELSDDEAKNYMKSIEKMCNINVLGERNEADSPILLKEEEYKILFFSILNIKLKKFLFSADNNQIINCILKNINEPEIRKIPVDKFQELPIYLIKKLKGDCKKKEEKIWKILDDKILNTYITQFVQIYLNLREKLSFLKPGDGVIEKEIEITDKINKQKSSS